MIKKLLFSAAVAAVALSANAETKVLWEAEEPEGFLVEWGKPALDLTAEQSTDIKAGTILTMTVSGVVADNGWPQVALFQGNKGWPPMINAGVGGKEYPFDASFTITPAMADSIQAYGITFKGDGAYVSKITQESSSIEVSPNAVWIGPKKLNWGDGIGVGANVFADLKVGDKVVAVYDKASESNTLQIILGGWNGENEGPNVATYQIGAAQDFMTIDEEAGTITIEFVEALSKLSWGDDPKDYDVFATVKAAGVQMQGPGIILNQVLYIQATDEPDDPTAVTSIENSNVAPVYYDMQGRKIANPLNGNIYIVKKGAKASKVVF